MVSIEKKKAYNSKLRFLFLNIFNNIRYAALQDDA